MCEVEQTATCLHLTRTPRPRRCSFMSDLIMAC
jgi:hypothetical protein